ncbi:hypothetical protein pipiens_014865 [Culex pipiens pipiens]|uniref:Retrotransposon gag domain-containing protein n=1 Tax=Culex pipiens pipiens TaxID=38569 RepID=A0ABD1CSS4_CULPP
MAGRYVRAPQGFCDELESPDIGAVEEVYGSEMEDAEEEEASGHARDDELEDGDTEESSGDREGQGGDEVEEQVRAPDDPPARTKEAGTSGQGLEGPSVREEQPYSELAAKVDRIERILLAYLEKGELPRPNQQMGQPVQEDQARASEEFVAAGASRDQFSERPHPTRQLEQPVTGGETPARVAPDSAMETAGVRWDQFPKFPKDVATTKLWEEWQQFYEDFEMATDVANVRDPYQRCKVLQLSLGGQLKAIVKAAGLIPFSNSADCYDTLVKGINEHLFDLTDSEAAHQNFTSMKQAPGESVAAYHARVTVSVKLCKYSEDDRGRFVRTQMINGMANKQLAKEARTHNWTTNYLVQAASRVEALPPAIDENENETVMAVAQQRPSNYGSTPRSSRIITQDAIASRSSVENRSSVESRSSVEGHGGVGSHSNVAEGVVSVAQDATNWPIRPTLPVQRCPGSAILAENWATLLCCAAQG